MNCHTCQAPLGADSKFCAQCGAPAAPAAPRRYMPKEVRERAAGFRGRRWVLDRVADWIDSGRERFFLITGEPGSGKTALAAWLAGAGEADPGDEILRRVAAGWRAMHFCVADDRHGSLHPDRFAQSLAEQLAGHYQHYAAAVLQRDNPSFDISMVAEVNKGTMVGAYFNTLVINSNFEDVYDRAVREPLVKVHAHDAGLRTLILVDAVDEAYTFGPSNIVTLLAGSNDLPEGVRFLLTSRNVPDIVRRFRPARRLDLSGFEHKADADEDIRAYVTTRLSALGGRGGPPRLAEDLVERAAGNFLYVKFLLDEVEQGRRSLDDADSLPKSLYSMYGSYLDRVVSAASPVGQSVAWREQYQPLLGCLSVALPAAPRRNLHRWMGSKEAHTNSLLADVAQITEQDVEHGDAYRLYHRSMAEFLASPVYEEAGAGEVNRYHTPPGDQHGRIIDYYTEHFSPDWGQCDDYGLRQLVSHLRARHRLAETQREGERLAELTVNIVLDEGFRKAQREKLGDVSATLEDLRTAINLALAHDKLVEALACVGVYRSTLRDSYFVEGVLEAVAAGDFTRALRRARHYRASTQAHGPWGRAFHLYLAWEAAEAGHVDAATGAAEAAEELPMGRNFGLCRALLARTAYALASRPQAGGRSALEWVSLLGPAGDDPQLVLNACRVGNPLPPDELTNALEGLRVVESRMAETAARMAAEWDPEKIAQLGYSFFDAESAAIEAHALAEMLAGLAGEETGRQRMESILHPIMSNPYPEYRDLAMAAMGVAILSVSDAAFVRAQLQRIFRTALNSEGVTFTFDLPSVLALEAQGRGLPADALGQYLTRAYGVQDLWGTKVKAQSALAAALYRQGRRDEAFEALARAAQSTTGFAGFITMHLLSVLNRWAEFGRPEGDFHALYLQAGERARRVSDWDFKSRRIRLVEDYSSWEAQAAGGLTLGPVREAVSKMNDSDARMAYVDFVSARWSWPADQPRWEELKALVPMALGHGTTLDAVLGRLFGLKVKQLTDDQLAKAMRFCAAHLTTGRPWELGR